jgi:hypothetical protein
VAVTTLRKNAGVCVCRGPRMRETDEKVAVPRSLPPSSSFSCRDVPTNHLDIRHSHTRLCFKPRELAFLASWAWGPRGALSFVFLHLVSGYTGAASGQYTPTPQSLRPKPTISALYRFARTPDPDSGG